MLRGILSLQSEVVYGHVGNAAARFALQRLGFEVWSVPTVLYSNHPGHGDFGGDNVAASEMTRLIDALDRQGHLARCDAVLTGYARTADQVAVMANAIDTVKTQNPSAVFAIDPVLGDTDTGAYVPLDVADTLPKILVPEADILMPNHFELEFLSGQPVTDFASTIAAALPLQSPIVVATSIPHKDKYATIAITDSEAWFVETDIVPKAPHGVGDLTSALFLGHQLLGKDIPTSLQKAVSSVYALIKESADRSLDELPLIQHQELIVSCPLLQVQEV